MRTPMATNTRRPVRVRIDSTLHRWQPRRRDKRMEARLEAALQEFNDGQVRQAELLRRIVAASRPGHGVVLGGTSFLPEHLDPDAGGPHPADTERRLDEAFPSARLQGGN
jgi:hypothetical protein